MKKNYEIKGMSCGGCVSNVRRALLEIPEVTEAVVQLNPQSAVLTMSKPIEVEELQAQLKMAGHYIIKEAVLN